MASKAQVDADAGDLKSKRALVAQQARADPQEDAACARSPGKLGISIGQSGPVSEPADKLVTLQTIDPIYVDFQSAAAAVAAGLGRAEGDADQRCLPGAETFTGKVNAINPKIDPSTRNVQIEATVPNAKRELAARHVRQRQGRPGRAAALSDLAADGDHVQPLRRYRIRRQDRRTRRMRRGNAQLDCAAGLRHDRSDRAATRCAIVKGIEAGHAGRHQRPGEAQERNAGGHRQLGAAGEQPQPDAAGTKSAADELHRHSSSASRCLRPRSAC